MVGREQDCQGGCFDSASGAVGKVSVIKDQEYGAQVGVVGWRGVFFWGRGGGGGRSGD